MVMLQACANSDQCIAAVISTLCVEAHARGGANRQHSFNGH